MKNRIISPILLLATFIFVGCEQVIPVDYDYDPKLAVAFSIESNSDTSIVYLSESRTILANYGIRSAAEADISVKLNGQAYGNSEFFEFSTLTVNNRPADTLTKFKFAHSGNIQSGDELSLEISHPRLETVTCITKVPREVQNISIDYVDSDTTQDEWGNEEIWHNYEIEFDDAGGDNYYALLADGDRYYFRTANQSILENQSTEVTDGAQATFITSDIYFSNQFFKGKRAKLILGISSQHNINHPFTYLVSLSNEELESRLAAVKQENTYTEFFSEPITIPTNIENGLGYFGYNFKYKIN